MSLDVLFRTQKFTTQYSSFTMAKLEELANKIILDEIHKTMKSENFSQKIIDATYVKSVDIKTREIKITSDYMTDDGYDVSLAREEGTADHKIEPKNKKVLSWVSNGVRFFSKGHWVKGVPGKKIMKNIAKKKSREINRTWDIEQDKFFQEMMTGAS